MLARKLELSQDKMGWDIGVRVLAILSLVEKEAFDEASLYVHSLKKQIQRLSNLSADKSGASPVSERNRLISKFLQLLDSKGFRFEQLTDKAHEILEKLHSADKPHRWEILSPELIPFHEWAGSKFKVKVKAKQSQVSDFKPKVEAGKAKVREKVPVYK